MDQEFGGRGLAGLLVRAALADSIRKNLIVVPVCPLFARHLRRHGDEFAAKGGVFRRSAAADIALVTRATRNRA
ncbi:GNAT family N-acetyltransferase [Nocardia rhamnosiphila]|uniref:GNAT family N-acetyltransferase n=1 Tax=Nocardia rhamnosiphila TaxID=426716 RepID=UPI0037B51243